MATFLQRLGNQHKAEEDYRKALQARHALEDAWASADPYQHVGPLAAGLGAAANDLYAYSAGSTHTARPGSRQHGDLPPFYRTESQQTEIIDAARIVEAYCPTAVNVLDVLTQFAIFTGFTYTVTERKKPGDRPEIPAAPDPLDPDAAPVQRPPENPLVAEVQAALDKWLLDVDWQSWESEIFRRTRRDGEAFLEFVDDEFSDLGVRLKSIEPEQVKEPTEKTATHASDQHSWKYGILTEKDDTATPIAYWVTSQYADKRGRQGEEVDADDVFHLKTEWVDRQAKRGVSDFFSVINDLPGVKKLLRNLREGATVQAAIAWIREHPEGSMPSALGSTPITNRHGDSTVAARYDGATILSVPQGMTYTAGPMGQSDKSSALIESLQAALRNIGSRWQMPEGLISGDSSNNNLASSLVAEGPFVRALEARQWHYRKAYTQLLQRVLDRAASAGRFGGARDSLWDTLELSVECKPVVARNQKEETERNEILSQAGILSNATWSAREDLDRDEERQNMAEDPTKTQAQIMGMEPGDDDDAADESKSNSEGVSV